MNKEQCMTDKIGKIKNGMKGENEQEPVLCKIFPPLSSYTCTS